VKILDKTEKIWMNGQFVDWDDAKVHVLTHALHYGTGIFEGIRCYDTDKGPAIFRAKEHFQRFLNSAKICFMDLEYSVDEFIGIARELLKINKLSEGYIRPCAFYGYGDIGIKALNNPIDIAMACWPWGTYLGEEALEKGVRCKMSSWVRIDSRMAPPLAKAAANYLNSFFAKREAIDCGYDDAILLNSNGYVSEGPGANLFIVKDDRVMTPPPSAGALRGITADAVMQISQDLGFELVSQQNIIREDLFLADEAFLTGTAVEVTPIREIDRRVIGSGNRGPITEKIQKTFFDIVKGKLENYYDWLAFV
jgi:branched-chain amino acid aminotransferase